MVTVRPATNEDIPSLLAMGDKFIKSSGYGRFVDRDCPEVEDGLRRIMDVGVVLVATVGDAPVGLLAAISAPIWFSPSRRIASEMAWWVSEDSRGGRAAVALIDAFEVWASDEHCDVAVLSDLVRDGVDVGKLLGKLGYQVAERSHYKVL